MQSIPLILALETATLGGSVCLARRDKVIASRCGDANISHSNSLLSDINDLLIEVGVSIQDVELFAAAVGPGSFTGLRIGLATVKALAATIGSPCVGIPTLNAIAAAAGPAQAIVALLPAGRGEAFAQLFAVTEQGEVRPIDKPAHLPPARLFERYSSIRQILWAGEGAHIHASLIKQHGLTRTGDLAEDDTVWNIAPLEPNLARYVARLALERYLTDQVATPESLQAIYVRPSDAELNVVNK